MNPATRDAILRSRREGYRAWRIAEMYRTPLADVQRVIREDVKRVRREASRRRTRLLMLARLGGL